MYSIGTASRVWLFVTVIMSVVCLSMGGRPARSERKFVSPVVDALIANYTARMKDRTIAAIFENALPNTLDTTIDYDESAGDTFVITGDIPAMWLRDSTNQVLPYLRFAKQDPKLQAMLRGVIHRQIHNVLLDPYANAYNKGKTGSPADATDKTTKLDEHGNPVNAMIPELWERKFEVDSLAAVVRLSTQYYVATGDSSIVTPDWVTAMRLIVQTLTIQQSGTYEEDETFVAAPPYTFARLTTQATDSLPHARGYPAKRCGLVKSGFRPSDDACLLPFLIPANAMAAVALTDLAAMLHDIPLALDLAAAAASLATTIKSAIADYAITVSRVSGDRVYAYEVDGFGSAFKMDDANIPSLLSLPYLGFCNVTDPLYVATRRMVLSPENPFYFAGKAGAGIGGPHVGDNYIWPMSIIMRALTSNDDAEIAQCLETLRDTTAGTYFMHESFYKDDASKFTRPWFAWANSLFGELILVIADTRPHLIF